MRSTAWAVCHRILPRPSRARRRRAGLCLTTRRGCSWAVRRPARVGDRRHRPVGADQLRPASARLDSRSRYLMARCTAGSPTGMASVPSCRRRTSRNDWRSFSTATSGSPTISPVTQLRWPHDGRSPLEPPLQCPDLCAISDGSVPSLPAGPQKRRTLRRCYIGK